MRTHRLDITHRVQFPADNAWAAGRIAKAVEVAQHQATIRAVKTVTAETVEYRVDEVHKGEFQTIAHKKAKATRPELALSPSGMLQIGIGAIGCWYGLEYDFLPAFALAVLLLADTIVQEVRRGR